MGYSIYKYSSQEADNINLGQGGVAFLSDTSALTPPSGQVIIAIQVVGSGTKIAALVAEDPTRWFNTVSAAYSGQNGDTWDTAQALYTGFTLHGRWTSLTLASNSAVIVYFGD